MDPTFPFKRSEYILNSSHSCTTYELLGFGFWFSRGGVFLLQLVWPNNLKRVDAAPLVFVVLVCPDLAIEEDSINTKYSVLWLQGSDIGQFTIWYSIHGDASIVVL